MEAQENKNILICLNTLGIGGVETACVTQIEEYARRNYKIYVLAPNGLYSEKIKKINNVHLIEFDYEHKNGIQISKINSIIDILEKYKINLVYIHKLECILSVFPACILSKVPYIAYLHMGILNTYDWYLGNLNISKAYLKAYFKCAYKIIGISDFTIAENRNMFDIPEENYQLIPNSIDFKEFENKELPNYKLEKLLLITRLDKDKGNGIKNTIEFFKEYEKRRPNATMDIIGDGAEKDTIEKEIRDKKLQNIRLIGPKNNIDEIMKDYDIVLGVDRCIQEAIAMKKISIIVGYDEFKGIVNYENIIDASKTNFSGRGLPCKSYKETVEKIIELSKDDIAKLVNKNYKWLYENRNIEKNIYEVKDIEVAKKRVENINYNKLMILFFEEIGNLQRKYSKEIKETWNIKESTEEYYLNRENWSNAQIEQKNKQIEEMKRKIAELEERKSNNNFFKKLKNKVLK